MAAAMAGMFQQLEFVWETIRKPVRKKAGKGAGAAPVRRRAGGKAAVVPDAELGEWCAEVLRGFGLARLARKVAVCWNPRMRTSAGRARWPEGRIDLNPRLRGVGEKEVRRTLRHELAHLIAYERAGRRRILPHGPEWRQACEDLGIAGEPVCHRLPFEVRRLRRRFAYKCPHCGEEFHRVRRFRHTVACWPCCRRFNGGKFDPRFRLVEPEL
jgi:predicted SprT family Zn-dependent metalloprotease